LITDQDIARINELYRKSKSPEGLTPEETKEQMELRGAYIAAVRRNLRGQLDTIKVQKEDGTIVDLKKKHREKYGN
jgi:uncharacterized protein YnzC (UPF0291/DUF896 family)